MKLESSNEQDAQGRYRTFSPNRTGPDQHYAGFLFVDSDWLSEHMTDDNLRVIEIDYESKDAYEVGHIPGAYLLSWNHDLGSDSGKDILDKRAFERIMSRIGATSNTEIVLYGDTDNFLAIFAFWIFQHYGHQNVKILDGGRSSWADSGRLLTKIVPGPRQSRYAAGPEEHGIRPDFSKATKILLTANSDDNLDHSQTMVAE